jgi:hypothetical protein
MRDLVNERKPLPDLRQEAERVITAVQGSGVLARLTGGVAIARRCPVASFPPFARAFADMDLVCTYKDRNRLGDLMVQLGYAPHQEFNGIHGHQRLYFVDTEHKRHVDVFMDAIRMCHVIDVSRRLHLLPDTLTPSDLLLTKLQIVELNHKDLMDLLALLHDQQIVPGSHGAIDTDYLARLWGSDWPIWRTSTMTLEKVRRAAEQHLSSAAQSRIYATLDALASVLEGCSKTVRWKLRSRVGDRVKWYNLPEEIE